MPLGTLGVPCCTPPYTLPYTVNPYSLRTPSPGRLTQPIPAVHLPYRPAVHSVQRQTCRTVWLI